MSLFFGFTFPSPHPTFLNLLGIPFFSKSHILSCLPQRLLLSRLRPACGKMVSEREKKKKSMPSPHLLSLISPTNPIGLSGKNWHGTKKAFRPTAGLTSYAKRQELKKHNDAVKELEREMKEEQEAERKVCRSESFSLLICLTSWSFCVLVWSPSLVNLSSHNDVIISDNTSLPKMVSLTDETPPGPYPAHQGPPRSQGGEATLREDGREDAPQETRPSQAQREAQQAAQLLRLITIFSISPP